MRLDCRVLGDQDFRETTDERSLVLPALSARVAELYLSCSSSFCTPYETAKLAVVRITVTQFGHTYVCDLVFETGIPRRRLLVHVSVVRRAERCRVVKFTESWPQSGN